MSFKLPNRLIIILQFLKKWGQTVVGYFPLTLRGLFGISVFILLRHFYGISEHRDLIILVLTTAGLCLIGTSIILVLIPALIFRIRKEKSNHSLLHLETQLSSKTGYQLSKLAWIPLLQVELRWKSPTGVNVTLLSQSGNLIEQVTPQRRNLQSFIARELIFSDPFGFARIRFTKTENREVKIYPNSGKVKPIELLKQMSVGETISHPMGEPQGDRIDIRRYVRGDPLKHVLWKIYARSRRLMVREVERAISPRQKTLAYLVAHEGDEVAAATVRTALEKGLFGSEFLFMADGEKEPTDQVPEAVEQIVRSSQTNHQNTGGLSRFLKKAQSKGLSGCLLFVPSRQGPWLNHVIHEIKQRGSEFQIFLGVDGVFKNKKRSQSFLKIRKFLFQTEHREQQEIHELFSVSHQLRKVGAQITLIDRTSGDLIAPQHLEKIFAAQASSRRLR